MNKEIDKLKKEIMVIKKALEIQNKLNKNIHENIKMLLEIIIKNR